MNTAVLLTTNPATRALRYDGRTLEPTVFDADYVRRLADCDEQTERHFTRYFGDRLKIKIRSRLRSHQAIEDVQQETFLRVFRNLRKDPESVRNPEQLGAYVNAICNNVLLEFFRSEGRFSNWDAIGAEPADERVNTANDYVTAERKRQVVALLEDLPKKDRELLKQVFLEERDKDEVCREYQVDRNYLRVLLYRARARFKANMLKTATARI